MDLLYYFRISFTAIVLSSHHNILFKKKSLTVYLQTEVPYGLWYVFLSISCSILYHSYQVQLSTPTWANLCAVWFLPKKPTASATAVAASLCKVITEFVDWVAWSTIATRLHIGTDKLRHHLQQKNKI